MDIKFTFEDGSESLAHYGVKGMKWKKHLKATDPEYLAQLGQNVQGLFGGAGQAIGQFYSNFTGKTEKRTRFRKKHRESSARRRSENLA